MTIIVIKILFWVSFAIVASASVAMAGYVAAHAGMRAPWNWLLFTVITTGVLLSLMEGIK